MSEHIGVPLASGFDYRPRTPDDDLPPEVQERILQKWREFDRAQAKAWAAARFEVIG